MRRNAARHLQGLLKSQSANAKTTPKMKGRKYLLAALRAKYTKRRPVSASSSLGWYIKLKTNSDLLPWYIDSGAEISVMPKTLYKKSYGDIHSTGRILFATGENALHTLLLGQPAIEKLGLIPNIPGAYRIRAVNSEQKEIP